MIHHTRAQLLPFHITQPSASVPTMQCVCVCVCVCVGGGGGRVVNRFDRPEYN